MQPEKNMSGRDPEWHTRKSFVDPSWPVTIGIAAVVITFALATFAIVRLFFWE